MSDFSDALAAMRNHGAEVTRSGWNGKGMRVYLLRHGFAIPHEGRVQHFAPCFVLVLSDGTHQPGWLPSQSDLLADDWSIA